MSSALNSTMAAIRQIRSIQKIKSDIQKTPIAKADNPLAKLGVMDLIPILRPAFKKPYHLKEMIDKLEESWEKPTRSTIVAPPQHGKSFTIMVFIVATLLRFPDRKIAYITYSADVAKAKGREIRALAKLAGIEITQDSDAKGEFVTTKEGGVVCLGIEQGLTSRAVDCALIDDPYKARKFARSKAWQRIIIDFFNDVAETRLRTNSSMFVTHTRWQTNDAIGMIKVGLLCATNEDAYKFAHIHLPAEDYDGNPLWPEFWSKERMAGLKNDVVSWWSLFMGSPRPDGAELFSNIIHTYKEEDLPPYMTMATGIDWAYSSKTSADSSVAITIGRYGEGEEARYYILGRISKQCSAPEFGQALKVFIAQHPQAHIMSYMAGTERGVASFITQQPPMGLGIPVDVRTPIADKLTRALNTSALWNSGKILLPEGEPWVQEFIDNMTSFTGTPGESDDDIDALVAACDVLMASAMENRVATSGKTRSTAKGLTGYSEGSMKRARSVW